MSQSQFKRVTKPKESTEEIKPNEIRITSQGRPRNYISYAVSLFEPSQEPQQATTQAYDTVVFKAMRRAINKAVSIVEIVKRRVKGLHQITEIHSTPITDEFEPKEEGLPKVTNKRTVSSVTITLSKKQLDKTNIGYQLPLSDKEVDEDMQKREQSQKERAARLQNPVSQDGGDDNAELGAQSSRPRRRGGRGRGRGGRGGFSNDDSAPVVDYQDSDSAPAPPTRGGRGGFSDRGDRGGRGRGGRGGRGGDRGGRGGRGGFSDRGGRGGFSDRGGRGGFSDRGGRGESRGGRGGRGGRGRGGRGGNAPTHTETI